MNAATAKRMVVEINGKTYGMDFDMMTLAVAEQTYEQYFDRKLNAQQIIAEVIGTRVMAVMALAYAAMRSAGEKLAWATFGKGVFDGMPLDWWAEVVGDGIVSMLGGAEGEDRAEDGEKN